MAQISVAYVVICLGLFAMGTDAIDRFDEFLSLENRELPGKSGEVTISFPVGSFEGYAQLQLPASVSARDEATEAGASSPDAVVENPLLIVILDSTLSDLEANDLSYDGGAGWSSAASMSSR